MEVFVGRRKILYCEGKATCSVNIVVCDVDVVGFVCFEINNNRNVRGIDCDSVVGTVNDRCGVNDLALVVEYPSVYSV